MWAPLQPPYLPDLHADFLPIAAAAHTDVGMPGLHASQAWLHYVIELKPAMALPSAVAHTGHGTTQPCFTHAHYNGSP